MKQQKKTMWEWAKSYGIIITDSTGFNFLERYRGRKIIRSTFEKKLENCQAEMKV